MELGQRYLWSPPTNYLIEKMENSDCINPIVLRRSNWETWAAKDGKDTIFLQ